MKNYNEMANDVLRRIGEHETEQRNKQKTVKRVIMPICCFCLVAILGIGLWQGNFFNSKPPITLDDSTIIGEKDTIDDKDGSGGNDDIDGHWSPNGQEAPPSDSSNSATSESSGTTNDNDVIDVIGMVKVDDITYVQCSTTTEIYTPNKYLGEAYDFEGTYQTHLSDVAGGLYNVKEDPNILMVELKNGDYVILIKEQNQGDKQG